MKFFNKKKEFRQTWTTSDPPAMHLMRKAKRWCQLNTSTGRFYFHYTNTRWWFENPEDALCFALTWAHAK